MTAPIQVPLVTKILNKAKAIVATIGSALTALSTLLPEGTYKGYVTTALVIVTGIGVFLAKNAPLIGQLADDAAHIGKHEAPPTV